LLVLAAEISEARSLLLECLSVRLSVRHIREPRLEGSRYRNTLHIIRQRDGSSLFRPNFAILIIEFWGSSQRSTLKRGSPGQQWKIGQIIRHIAKRWKIRGQLGSRIWTFIGTEDDNLEW